jgi:ribosome-associated protein
VTDQPDRQPQDVPAAATTAADAAAGPADAQAPAAAGRRPGLPHREPGQTRKRPARKPAQGVGDGSIDPGEPDPTALAMARRIVDLAEDKKASDIVLLDVRALTAVTDYFIICSGTSERQLGSIVDGIAEGLKEDGILPLGREGGATSHWVLLDLGAAIVHVMATPEREYYQLEKLWADATLLLHVL